MTVESSQVYYMTVTLVKLFWCQLFMEPTKESSLDVSFITDSLCTYIVIKLMLNVDHPPLFIFVICAT